MARRLQDDPVYSRFFALPIPHVEALGILVVETGPRRVVMRLPVHGGLVGNPDSGALHGGAITTLIDTAAGCLAMASLEEPSPVATLDLRVDFLRPALDGLDVEVEAVCHQVTRQVVFCRAEAWQGERAAPIAAALGSFMIAGPPLQAAEDRGSGVPAS